MSEKEDKKFAAWVDELSKQVEADEREPFEAWAKTKSARETYRGYLREQEFHRKYNEVQQQAAEVEDAKEQLAAWYEEEAPKNAALLKEREELKAQLAELGLEGPPPAPSTPGFSLSPDEFAELKKKADKVEALDKLIPAVLADMGAVIKDSIKNNFDIDPREVIKLSLQQGIEPYRAFEILTADERQKRHEASQKAERDKWFEEGRRSALTKNSPDHLQPSGPSVVDYLQGLNKETARPSERGDRINAALKEFMEGGLT